jgi:hypothetical protein
MPGREKTYGFGARDVSRIAQTVRESERRRGYSGQRANPPVMTAVGQDFYNDSGSSITVPARGVARFVSETVDNSRRYLTVAKPNATFQKLYVVADADDVPYQSFGQCYLPGSFVLVAYDSGTPAAGEVWGVKDNQFTATRNGPGMFLVTGIEDASAKIMRAYFLPLGLLLGKNSTGSSIGANTSGTITLFAGTVGSEATTGLTVSARNRGSIALANNKMCTVSLVNGEWYCFPLECP